MQEGEPKNGYREQEAAGGTYAPKKVPELERQRQARIKRLQELERQQIYHLLDSDIQYPRRQYNLLA